MTVAEIGSILDQMLADYEAGKIAKGPARDRATEAALTDAITKMKTDLAKIPPNGVANVGNVKRKEFRDSKGKLWRVDVENNAGKNLTQ